MPELISEYMSCLLPECIYMYMPERISEHIPEVMPELIPELIIRSPVMLSCLGGDHFTRSKSNFRAFLVGKIGKIEGVGCKEIC